MSPPVSGPAADLWSFMLAIYARPGVAPACLRLQEAHGLDVPLFLAALYGAAGGRRLDTAAMRSLDGACAEWRDQVIRPLRQVRRAMKDAHLLGWHPDVPALREAVKAQELQAENIQVRVLEAMILALPEAARPNREDALPDVSALVLDLCDPGREERLPADARNIAEACRGMLGPWPRPPGDHRAGGA